MRKRQAATCKGSSLLVREKFLKKTPLSTTPSLGSRRSDATGSNYSLLKLKKRVQRSSFHAPYIILAALVLGTVVSGYQAQSGSDTQAAQLSKVTVENSQPSVDQVAAAELAAVAAQSADLAVAGDVMVLATSLSVKTQLAQTDSAALTKPQLLSDTGSRGTREHKVIAGDTVQSLAVQYGVSEDSIKWSNKLTGNEVTEGKTLLIPGTTGIVYTVKPGDSPDALAQKYKADRNRIVTYNDAELAGLVAGQRIVIPDGILPETERPGYRDSLVSSDASRTLVSIKTGDVAAAPVGPVRAGDIIGYVGNTGFSTGPHAHLEARLDSRIVDPNLYFFSGEWQQPLSAPVSQSYGNPSSWYTRGYHPGTDYAAPMGTPLRAVADGVLYRGCTSVMFGPGYGNAYGYVAVIDHGNGLQSLYGHMVAGPDGAACNY